MTDASADRTYTISTTLSLGYAQSVDAVRDALGEQGFGVLTEIDLAATMKTKFDKDIARQVILGAREPGGRSGRSGLRQCLADDPTAGNLDAKKMEKLFLSLA